MATVSVTRINLDLANEMGRLVTREDMRQVGLTLIQRIWARTKAGKDYLGNTFAPLSADYARRKQNAGLTLEPLHVSGEMLRAMAVVEATPTKVVLGFNR